MKCVGEQRNKGRWPICHTRSLEKEPFSESPSRLFSPTRTDVCYVLPSFARSEYGMSAFYKQDIFASSVFGIGGSHVVFSLQLSVMMLRTCVAFNLPSAAKNSSSRVSLYTVRVAKQKIICLWEPMKIWDLVWTACVKCTISCQSVLAKTHLSRSYPKVLFVPWVKQCRLLCT